MRVPLRICSSWFYKSIQALGGHFIVIPIICANHKPSQKHCSMLTGPKWMIEMTAWFEVSNLVFLNPRDPRLSKQNKSIYKLSHAPLESEHYFCKPSDTKPTIFGRILLLEAPLRRNSPNPRNRTNLCEQNYRNDCFVAWSVYRILSRKLIEIYTFIVYVHWS